MNKGTLDMFYIKTDYNIADIFTKALYMTDSSKLYLQVRDYTSQGGVLR